MTHKINYVDLNVPEVDAFLSDYAALCIKHGMAFDVDSGYDDDGPTIFLTAPQYVEPGRFNAPDLDYATDVPAIDEGRLEAKLIKDTEADIQLAREKMAFAMTPAGDPVQVLTEVLADLEIQARFNSSPHIKAQINRVRKTIMATQENAG